MSRRMYLILLPVLALILSIINCREDNAVQPAKSASGYAFLVINPGDHHGSVVFGKETNHKHKNAIRIKAWDDSVAIAITLNWLSVPCICYFSKQYYWSYNSPIISHQVFRRTLRGPPVV
jgi:hypothetical protein